jgi:hypothetical protein
MFVGSKQLRDDLSSCRSKHGCGTLEVNNAIIGMSDPAPTRSIVYVGTKYMRQMQEQMP